MHLHLPRRDPGPEQHGSRAWAWLHQFDLDRQLADGLDPASSQALRTRANQLQSTHFRRELVAQLDGALAKAEHPPHWHSPSLPVRAQDILAAREQLLTLRALLCDPGARSARGIALAACLINDPRGPLYHAGASTIAELAESACTALSVAEAS